MGYLSGKTVLISDASSPSGKALSKAFAGEGANLAHNFRCEEDAKASGQRGAYCFDTSKSIGADALADNVIKDFGGVDVLIHNDNEVTPFTIAKSTDEWITQAMDRNAKSAFMLTQAVGRHMKDRKSGCIIYLSSIHADKPSGSSFAYSMAKAAVGMLCKEVVINLSKYGIRTNVIEMGPTQGEEGLFHSDISKLYDHLDEKTYGQGLGDWDQAARLAVFLAGDSCPFLNGESIKLDEGFLLHYTYQYNYEEVEEVMRNEPER